MTIHRRCINKTNSLLLCILCPVICVLIFLGCASVSQKKDILAVVDGESITKADLEYSLEIAHRREDLSSARDLNISQYVQKLIDERLIVQEAWRMGMEEYPEVQKKIHAYTLRESVTRLYNDEIVQKVSVTEKDIANYYKKNYEQFFLGIIEVALEEDSGEIFKKLKSGDDFMELARKYSTHYSKKDGGDIILKRKAMGASIEEAVSDLKAGEISDVIKSGQKYYIVRLISRQEAPDEELEGIRRNIEKTIRKQKQKERSDEYLRLLREQAGIKIDRKLLASINQDVENEELEKWSNDKRLLVEAKDLLLTAGDFVAMLPPNFEKSKERNLNSWIDRKLVDREALSRHYEMKPPLKGMLLRYKNQVLNNTFVKKALLPKIEISEKDLEGYYLSHQEDFLRPVRYKIQQITLKTKNEAEDTLNSLHNGADFSWLAKKKSTDEAAPKGGNIGWVTKDQLPEPAGKIVDNLKPGDISPILEVNSFYRIIKLQKKTGQEVKKFDRVKASVYRKLFAERYSELYTGYIDELKEDAQINIYDEAVQSFEEIFKK